MPEHDLNTLTLWLGPQIPRLAGYPEPASIIAERAKQLQCDQQLDPGQLGMLKGFLTRSDWARAAKLLRSADPDGYALALSRAYRTKQQTELPHFLRILAVLGFKRVVSGNPVPQCAALFGLDALTWLDDLDLSRWADRSVPGILYAQGHAGKPASLAIDFDAQKALKGAQGTHLRAVLRQCLQQGEHWFVGFQPREPLPDWLPQQDDDGFRARILLPQDTESRLPVWLEPLFYARVFRDEDVDLPGSNLSNWLQQLARKRGKNIPHFSGKTRPATQPWRSLDAAGLKLLAGTDPQAAKDYLSGKPITWEIVRDGYTAPRLATDKVLALFKQGKRVVLLKGASCEGKSTVLKQVAVALMAQGYRVLEPASVNSQLRNLPRDRQGRWLVLLDQAVHMHGLPALINQIQQGKETILLMAARTHEWQHAYGRGDMLMRSLPQVDLEQLSELEAQALAQTLLRTGCVTKRPEQELVRALLKGNRQRYLLAAMLEVLSGKPFQEVLRAVVQEIQGWLDGALLLRALGLVVLIENLPIKKGTPFRCPEDLFREVLALENRPVSEVCDRLAGEVGLQEGKAHEIATRDQTIAKALYPILFAGEVPILDEAALNEDIVWAASRLAHSSRWARNLLTILPRHLAKRGRKAEAVQLLELGSKVRFDAVLWHTWANIAREQGHIGDMQTPKTARWLFHKATEADPANTPSWQAWALLEAEQGNIGTRQEPGSARYLMHQAVEADPSNVPSWRAWALLEAEQGNLGSIDQAFTARALFNEASKLDPLDARGWQTWAVIEARAGNLGSVTQAYSARWLFRQGIELGPRDPSNWSIWASWEYWAGSKQDALTTLEQALSYCPKEKGLLSLQRSIQTGEGPQRPEKYQPNILAEDVEQPCPQQSEQPSPASPQSEWQHYQRALKLAQAEASEVKDVDVIDALGQIAPLLKKRVLREPELGRLESEPVAMIVLPKDAHPESQANAYSLVYAATRDGSLYSFKLADPEQQLVSFKPKLAFTIPDFDLHQHRVLGLYWKTGDMTRYPDLYLTFQKGVNYGAYKLNLSPKNPKPILLEEIPAYLTVCPIATNPGQSVFDLAINEPPPAGTVSAVWHQDRLYTASPLPNQADFKSSMIHTLGGEILVFHLDQNITAEHTTPPHRVWRWFSRHQPICICPLPKKQGVHERFILADETGALAVAVVMEQDWAQNLWKDLRQHLVSRLNLQTPQACQTPQAWLDWASTSMSQGLQSYRKVAILKLLLEYLLSLEEVTELPDLAQLFRHEVSGRDYLALTSSIRNTIKTWEKPGKVCGARMLLHVYRNLHFRQRDTVDIELKRHQTAVQPDKLSFKHQQEEDAYQALMRNKDLNCSQLLADPRTLVQARVAVWSEAWMNGCWLTFSLRWSGGQDGFLRSLPGQSCFYWLAGNQIRRIQVKEQDVPCLEELEVESWQEDYHSFALAPSREQPGFLGLHAGGYTALRFDNAFKGSATPFPTDDLNVLKITAAGEDHLLLLVREAENRLSLHLRRADCHLARYPLAFSTVNEWVVHEYCQGSNWRVACDVGNGQLVILEICIKPEHQLTQVNTRTFDDRIRSLSLAARNERHWDLLVGTTSGNLVVLDFSGERPSLNLRWLQTGFSAIRHLDVASKVEGGYQVLALTAYGEVWVLDHWGRFTTRRQMYSTFRSGAILEHAGRTYIGVVDIRGVFCLLVQPEAKQAKQKVAILTKSSPAIEGFPHDELSAWQRLEQGNLDSTFLNQPRSAKARACLIKGLAEQVLHPSEHAQAAPLMEQIQPELRLEDLATMARIRIAEHSRERRDGLICQILPVFGHCSNTHDTARLQQNQLNTILADLILGLGRSLMTPKWVFDQAELWNKIPEAVRHHVAVDTAVLLNGSHMKTNDELKEEPFCVSLCQATYLGPGGLDALLCIAPTEQLKLMQALCKALWAVAKDESVSPKTVNSLKDLSDLSGVTRSFVGLIRFLLDEQMAWGDLMALARYEERGCTEYTRENLRHPAIDQFTQKIRKFSFPDSHESLPLEEQIKSLKKIELETDSLLQEAGCWHAWMVTASKRLATRAEQMIAARVSYLRGLCRIHLLEKEIEFKEQGLVTLRVRLGMEGQPQDDTRFHLKVDGGFSPLEGTLEGSWHWRILPRDALSWTGHVTSTTIKLILSTSGDEGEQYAHRWTIPVPANPTLGADEFLARYPSLLQHLVGKVVQQESGFRILAYDEELGSQALLAQLGGRPQIRLIDLDCQLRTKRHDKDRPFSADTILKALDVTWDQEQGHIPTKGYQTIVLHPCVETATKLLQHRETLDRLVELARRLDKVPVLWLLPLKVAVQMQASTLFPLLPLYFADAGDALLQAKMTETLAQQTDFSPTQLMAVLRDLHGNLRLLRCWLSQPKPQEVSAFLGQNKVSQLMLDELAQLELMDYANLIVLAFRRTPLSPEWLVPGLQAAIAPHEGEPATAWVKGYAPSEDQSWTPPSLQTLFDLGRIDVPNKRQRCRQLFAQRSVLTDGEVVFLNKPYQTWLEALTQQEDHGRSIMELLLGQPIMAAISLMGMAAAHEGLSQLGVDLSKQGRQLLLQLQGVYQATATSDQKSALAKALTGAPVLPLDPDPTGWQQELCQALHAYLAREHIFPLAGKTHPMYWLVNVSKPISNEIDAIQQVLRSYRDYVNLILFGPGLGDQPLAEKSKYLYAFSNATLKEVVTNDRPKQRFWQLVGSRFGLQRLSPFQVGMALPEDSPVFVGRETELQDILARLDRKSFLILGGRQIGKTSLLKHLHAKLKIDPKFTPIYLSCEDIAEEEAFIDQIKYAFSGLKLEYPQQANPRLALEDAFRQLSSPVLLINEVDGLARSAPHLMARLRALSENQHLQCVMAGYHGAHGATQDIEHPFFNWVSGNEQDKALILGQLEPKPALALVDKLEDSQLSLSWENEEARFLGRKALLQRSYRIPYLLQGACQSIVNHLDRQGRAVIKLDDIQSGSRGRPAWDYLNNIKTSVKASNVQTGKAGELMTQSPEERYWSQWVLAAICDDIYGKQAPDSYRDSNAEDQCRFTITKVLKATQGWLKEFAGGQLREKVDAHFPRESYQQLLDLWTLTVILSPSQKHPNNYFFQEHMYPIELHTYLKDRQPIMNDFIEEQLIDLGTLLGVEVT